MAYSEDLAERVRKIIKRQRGISEKKMFGGFVSDARAHVLRRPEG